MPSTPSTPSADRGQGQARQDPRRGAHRRHRHLPDRAHGAALRVAGARRDGRGGDREHPRPVAADGGRLRQLQAALGGGPRSASWASPARACCARCWASRTTSSRALEHVPPDAAGLGLGGGRRGHRAQGRRTPGGGGRDGHRRRRHAVRPPPARGGDHGAHRPRSPRGWSRGSSSGATRSAIASCARRSSWSPPVTDDLTTHIDQRHLDTPGASPVRQE